VTTPDKEARPRLVTPTFFLITAATFSYFMAVGALIPTLPRYVEGPLGGSSTAVGLAVGSFAISAVLLRPYIGSIGDQRGRRLLMLGGAGVVGLAVAGYAISSSLWLLVLLRVFTGAGEAAFYVGAASAINDLAPDERRGEALSYFSLALYSGLAIGPIVGETVLEEISFDATWLTAAAFAFVACVLAVRVPDTRVPASDDEPPPLRRIIHPAGLKPGTILATSIWGLAGFSAFVPLYALDIGMSGSRAVFFTYAVIVLGIRSFGARIPDILGPRKAATIALTFSSTALALIGIWDQPAGLFTGAVIFGIGQALMFPALMTIAIRGSKTSERGAIVGTFTAFFDLAFGLGSVSLGTIAGWLGYRGLFLTAAGVALIGLLMLQGYAYRSRRAAPAVEEARSPERTY
jgi:MFS family permease